LTELDINFVRSQFPAFAEPTLEGQAFFENAGGSYTCQQVIGRLDRYYRQRKVQPYSVFAASQLAGAEMDEARQRLSAMLGVDSDELSFGPSTSANTYVLAQAFGQMLRPGDAIIVTNQDHEANTGIWRRLAAHGIEVREWRIDPVTGHLSPDDLANLLDDKIRLVCFPHCSNVVGEINRVAEICAIVRAAGALSCVDGVSYAPHGLPNVGTLGADIYLFSTYKTYGPHQGLMVVRRDLATALPNQGHTFNGDILPARLTPAGPDHAQIAACAGIADYIDAVYAQHCPNDLTASPVARAQTVHDLMRAHEVALLAPLLDYLGARNDLRILGPQDARQRAPTVALSHARPGESLATALAPLGIMAGGGSFYADRALLGQGIAPEHGVLRLSFVHYTSRAEVDQLIVALDKIL
jgi:selenocysteine lyase/cysteine desulfurase